MSINLNNKHVIVHHLVATSLLVMWHLVAVLNKWNGGMCECLPELAWMTGTVDGDEVQCHHRYVVPSVGCLFACWDQ